MRLPGFAGCESLQMSGGVRLTSLMPAWGHTIDERHINAVVLYIRSLRR